MSDDGMAVDEQLSDEEQQMAKLKEAIVVKTEDVGSLQKKLTITVPKETVDERMGEQFRELKRDAAIPGFRKGRAPMKLVEKRFGADVGDQLKSQLLSSAYLAAAEKEDIKALGDPLIWTSVTSEKDGDDSTTEKLLPFDEALDHFKLPQGEGLTFSCEVELKPQFELPELDGIPVEKIALAVSDDDIDATIKNMCMSRGSFKPIEKGGAEEDDMLYVSAKFTCGDTVLLDEESYDIAARDIVVKGVRLKGLKEVVVGKEVGDTGSLETTVPDDHTELDLRGKVATFDFTVREIKRLLPAEIDETLLASVGVESEEELREAIKSNLDARLDDQAKQHMEEQIGNYLVDNTEMDVPQGLSQRQSERSVARRTVEMLQAGMPPSEVEKAADEMRTAAQDQTVRDLKLFFILEKIAEEQNVEVGEEEINGAIAMMAQQANMRFDRMRDELSKDNRLMTLYVQLRDRQVLAQLLEKAEITETKGPKKAAAKKTSKKPAAKKKTVKKAEAKVPAKKATAKKTTKKTAAKKTTTKKTSK